MSPPADPSHPDDGGGDGDNGDDNSSLPRGQLMYRPPLNPSQPPPRTGPERYADFGIPLNGVVVSQKVKRPPGLRRPVSTVKQLQPPQQQISYTIIHNNVTTPNPQQQPAAQPSSATSTPTLTGAAPLSGQGAVRR